MVWVSLVMSTGKDGEMEMTYAIYEIFGVCTKRKIDAPEFATLDAAHEFATEKFAKVLAFIEKDEDADAYDFITTIGGQYAIEATPA